MQKVKSQKRIVAECRGCRWKWAPNPKLWRNKKNAMKPRTLKCPACGLPNRISAEDVERIWKHNY